MTKRKSKTKDDALRQPIDDVQLNQLVIEWVAHGGIRPNRYNPNRMTGEDRALLRQSLLEDGWTQPIVTLPDGTIVDGEQRWTTAGLPLKPAEVQAVIDKMEARRAAGAVVSESIMERLTLSKARLETAIAAGEKGCIAAITGGMVPVTRVDFKDDAHKMISTIRHNRARGAHAVNAMGDIMADLRQLGLDFDDFEKRLGMDFEEVDRLLETRDIAAQVFDPDYALSPARTLVHVAESETDDISGAAVDVFKEHALAEAAHERQVAEEVQARIEAREESADTALTQIEREKIEREVRRELPAPPPPRQAALRKITFFVTKEQYEAAMEVLGDPPVDGFLALVAAERGRRGLPVDEAEAA